MALKDSKSAVVMVVAILLMVALAVFLIDNSDAWDGPVDAAGNPISFSSTPQTIISTAPSITETLIATGMFEKIVGVSSNCDDPEILEMVSDGDAQVVGSYHQPNAETIMGIEADVVFLVYNNPNVLATYNQLRNSQVSAVLLFGDNTIGNFMTNIGIIGVAMDDEDGATFLQNSINQSFSEIVERAANSSFSPKVLINLGIDLINNYDVYGAGIGTFGSDILSMANSTNVLSISSPPVSGWSIVNLELMLDDVTAPDVLIIMAYGPGITDQASYDEELQTLRNHSVWGNTPAVLNGEVYFLCGKANSVGQRASPNLVDFAKLVLMFTHPELFDSLVLPGFIGDDYRDFIENNW